MENDSKIIEQLPYAIFTQWKNAQLEATKTEWAYVSGMIAMEISRNPCPELMTAHNVATQRGLMAAKGSTNAYASLTPAQRLQELFSVTTRMKAHSVILSQFFTRPATKAAAIAGMNQEIENMQILWALVRADLEGAQS
ncbi:hypothetical protein [Thiothrix subterranea]|uniref:Uncharacterized protein n=1 Tax=Thiothrix subterranea TaxID=2735563 RepID=A0AA51MS10_9GAMM|nr:hypothetical protein [Thiothrix subterranea]MDQ5770826.1 hypothetical protein [Thiothrix subterranea]WML87256.1 hypothetical protein RCG00_02595 [Thiothrix subterranea]